MKIGLSTYSLSEAVRSNEMTVFDVIQWISKNGGEHVEIAPFKYDLEHNPDLIEAICRKVKEEGIVISNYCLPANFIKEDQRQYELEIERVKKHVQIAARLGVKRMRHDVASRPISECTVQQLETDWEQLVYACRIVADYAAEYGITTSVENHGYHLQGSDRILRLIHAVDRPNFKITLDIGNFLCVDEDPVSAVKKTISYTSMVHLKDFYLRPSYKNPGEGWFQTSSENYLRGAIVGQGDIDIREIIKVIKQFEYDGYISIEFEGMEDCKLGSRIGMDNAKRFWSEA